MEKERNWWRENETRNDLVHEHRHRHYCNQHPLFFLTFLPLSGLQFSKERRRPTDEGKDSKKARSINFSKLVLPFFPRQLFTSTFIVTRLKSLNPVRITSLACRLLSLFSFISHSSNSLVFQSLICANRAIRSYLVQCFFLIPFISFWKFSSPFIISFSLFLSIPLLFCNVWYWKKKVGLKIVSKKRMQMVQKRQQYWKRDEWRKKEEKKKGIQGKSIVNKLEDGEKMEMRMSSNGLLNKRTVLI